jgi:Mn2+/Fe2+ NRAMP family transporter
MIAILVVVIGALLVFGMPKQASKLSRVVLGLILLVTALPLALSFCSSATHEGASTVSSLDLPWGWVFFGVVAVVSIIAYVRFRGRKEQLAKRFPPPATSLKRRVDR